MPCNCDYMEARPEEVAMSEVACLLGELEGRAWNKSEWRGYHPLVYKRKLTKKDRDDMIDMLCTRLQQVDITQYSLEMQLWWRDHQEADRKRLLDEQAAIKEDKERAVALAKLTAYERKLLGVCF